MSSYKCCSAGTRESNSILEQMSLLKSIGNESRLRILCILFHGPHRVGDLASSTKMSQSLTSHHLAYMRKSELVVGHKRQREVYYDLTPKGKKILRFLKTV